MISMLLLNITVELYIKIVDGIFSLKNLHITS